MSSNLDQLTNDAMKLPLRERVQLAQRLVSTIDDEVESILRRCGLLKRSGDWKSFGAGKFKAFQRRSPFVLLAKRSSNESHLFYLASRQFKPGPSSRIKR